MTLSGGGGRGTGKCHQMTQGGGGLAKVSRDIFSKILSYNDVFWTAFLKGKGHFFGKPKCHVTSGVGGSMPVSPNDSWVRGV